MEGKKAHLWSGWSSQYPGWFQLRPDPGATHLIEWAFWHVPYRTQQTIHDHAPFLHIEEILLPFLVHFLVCKMLGKVRVSLNLPNKFFQFRAAPIVPLGQEMLCTYTCVDDFMYISGVRMCVCVTVCVCIHRNQPAPTQVHMNTKKDCLQM